MARVLKKLFQQLARVAVLWSAGFEKEPTMKGMQVTARSIGVELQSAQVKACLTPGFGYGYGNGSRSIGSAFTWATRGQAGAFILLPSSILGENLDYIADLGLKKRLPGIFWREEFAEAGGLMAYGANQMEQSRRAAYVVDKILKGAKPAELPVELPTQFKLVINLKTAKEIGVKIPDKMLTWADRIIK